MTILVYVLCSKSNGRRYVGITYDLEARLKAHRARRTKGGQQLGAFEVVLKESYPSYAEARGREKFLKSGQGRIWLDRHLEHRD